MSLYTTRSVKTIAGVAVKQPSSFNIEKYNLTKSGRLASGKMTMELIAKKRKFQFRYNIISGAELDTILSSIDGDDMFFDLEYEENGVIKTATVYVGAIRQTPFRTDGRWYWKDVAFDLIEQ